MKLKKFLRLEIKFIVIMEYFLSESEDFNCKLNVLIRRLWRFVIEQNIITRSISPNDLEC